MVVALDVDVDEIVEYFGETCNYEVGMPVCSLLIMKCHLFCSLLVWATTSAPQLRPDQRNYIFFLLSGGLGHQLSSAAQAKPNKK